MPATLDQLLQSNADVFARQQNILDHVADYVGGTIDDPTSYDASGGRAGPLGYYPVQNGSGATVYAPCMARVIQSAGTVAFGSRFANKFSPLDDGLVMGAISADPARDLAVGQANRAALARTVARMRAAKAAGASRPQLVLPNGPVLIAIAPFAGSAPPQAGVSAVGGGHYLGPTALPLTGGWSAHGLVIDGLSGFDLISEGCRLLRLETDPYNGETANDAVHSTILVSRCSDFTLRGEFFEEGYQVGFASAYGSQGEGPTSGNFVDISYGCTDFDVRALVEHWKGSNALAIGLNRAAGFSSVSGISGYDTLQPCLRFRVDTVHGIMGEHALFVNMADQWSVDHVRKTTRDYAYKGVQQDRYSQRGVYLQGAGRGRLGRVEIYDVWKAGMFVGLYDTRRSYANLDLTIDSLFVQASLNQNGDYHSGFEFFNHNLDPAYLRIGRIDVGSYTARGVKSGFVQRDDGVAALSQSKVLCKLNISRVDIQATGNGIVSVPGGQDAGITIGDGEIAVAADARYSDQQPVQGLNITSAGAVAALAAGQATAMTTDVRVGNLAVRAANRPVTFAGIRRLTIGGLAADYVEAGVAGANNKPITINRCTNYGGIDYRTSDGAPATQRDVLEPAPSPGRGVWYRTFDYDPGPIGAGGEVTIIRSIAGLRAGHLPLVSIETLAGITARVAFDSADNAAVTYRNDGAAAVTPGPITTTIAAIAYQIAGGA